MANLTHQKTRVWLVEDNAASRSSVERLLNQLDGMKCAERFASAEEASAQIETGATGPAVILLDVQLPGLDGTTPLSGLRERAPEVRILILTEFDDVDTISRAVCAGTAGYLLKSAGVDEIREAVRQVMDGGAPMTPFVARKVLETFSRGETDASPRPGNDYKLTGREQEILLLMADGLIKKEIAESLEISVHTVSTHLRSVYEKLQVNTNTGAVAKALREGII